MPVTHPGPPAARGHDHRRGNACTHRFRARSPHPRVARNGDAIELVALDMDGVLIDVGSSWVMVHRAFGVANEASLRLYLDGLIDDMEFIRRDVALWTRGGPVSLSRIEDILSEPPLMPGADEFVEGLADRGIVPAIVSGGIDLMAQKVARRLGIRDVYANGLAADAAGHLTGEGILRTPLKDKSVPLRELATRHGVALSAVASVGNSCPDVAMFEASGLAIAFNPEDECVRQAAHVVVEEKDLTRVLPHLVEAA